jgi:hypothetical protein
LFYNVLQKGLLSRNFSSTFKLKGGIVDRAEKRAERIMAFVASAVMVLAVLIMAGVIIDQVSASSRTARVVVEAKEVIPAHTTTTRRKVGGISSSHKKHHPEAYRLCFNIDGHAATIWVEKDLFDGLHVGDEVEADYRISRIVGRCTLDAVRPINNQ